VLRVGLLGKGVEKGVDGAGVLSPALFTDGGLRGFIFPPIL